MEEIRSLVLQALGEASMCWSETPKGVFDGTRAIQIGEDLLKAIDAEYQHHAEKLMSQEIRQRIGMAL